MIRVSIADTGKIYVTIPDDGPIRIRMFGIEPIRINAFNYPPEIDRLNQEVIEAKEDASNATELATQASQAATSATETANAAGNLSAQAAQAAQQAEEIAEGAATTAGEAVQSINEHASSTTNPHPTNVTQEFADTQITPLAVEATYTPTVWSYLVGLFTTVPKSVKEHIVKGWDVIENLKSRISFLENNLIVSITLTESVASLEIQLPTPEQDIEVEVDYTMNIDFAVPGRIQINDVTGGNYVVAATQTSTGFTSYVGRYSAKGTYRFTLINGYVFCNTAIQQIWGTTSTQNVSSRALQGYLKTAQAAINKITFDHQINAGSTIKVRRVKRHA